MQKFRIVTRLLCWDDEAFYLEQRFVGERGFVHAIAVAKQTVVSNSKAVQASVPAVLKLAGLADAVRYAPGCCCLWFCAPFAFLSLFRCLFFCLWVPMCVLQPAGAGGCGTLDGCRQHFERRAAQGSRTWQEGVGGGTWCKTRVCMSVIYFWTYFGVSLLYCLLNRNSVIQIRCQNAWGSSGSLQ